MKFLADMGVSMTTVSSLRQLGHDAVHLREQGLMRMEDPAIAAKARSQGRIVMNSGRVLRIPISRIDYFDYGEYTIL